MVTQRPGNPADTVDCIKEKKLGLGALISLIRGSKPAGLLPQRETVSLLFWTVNKPPVLF